MAQVNCRDCGALVSARALSCPHCALPTPIAFAQNGWQMKAAANYATQPEVLQAIFQVAQREPDGYENPLRTLAYNRSLPHELFVQLSTYRDPDIREAVAINPSVPRDVLQQLSVDEHPGVREAVASAASDPELLETLAQDNGRAEEWSKPVRESAAGNPMTPRSALIGILAYRDRQLDFTVARNPSIDSEIAEMLLSRDPNNARALALNTGLSETLLRRLFDVRYELFDRGSNSEFDYLNRLARNESMPVDVLENLASSYAGYCAEPLVGNKNLPLKFLDQLLQRAWDDPQTIFANCVATEFFLNVLEHPKLPKERFDSLIERVGPHMLLLVRSVKVPQETLADLAADPDPKVRQLVARRPELTADLIASLMEDEDEVTRTNAWKTSYFANWFMTVA